MFSDKVGAEDRANVELRDVCTARFNSFLRCEKIAGHDGDHTCAVKEGRISWSREWHDHQEADGRS